jgi:hypothetical protein
MKNLYLIFALSILTAFSLSAQDTLLLQDNPVEKMVNKKGPNSPYFSHLYLAYKSPVPPQNEGSEVLFWRSYGMDFGYRNKVRVSNFYSLGFSFAYSFNRYRMAQVEEKITPDMAIYDEQYLRNNEWRLEFYNRFNLDWNRGNTIGNFIDVGVYGTYHFWNKVKTETETDNLTVITIAKKLDYVEPWGYGAFAHLGFGAYVLTFEYRHSPYFKEDSGYPDLPQFKVGLQLGIHD